MGQKREKRKQKVVCECRTVAADMMIEVPPDHQVDAFQKAVPVKILLQGRCSPPQKSISLQFM